MASSARSVCCQSVRFTVSNDTTGSCGVCGVCSEGFCGVLSVSASGAVSSIMPMATRRMMANAATLPIAMTFRGFIGSWLFTDWSD